MREIETDVESLIAYLRSSYAPERLAAAELLGKIGDARAVGPLAAALRDEDSGVRKVAAEALDKFGDVRAVEPLVAVLRDENSGIRRMAALVLSDFFLPPSSGNSSPDSAAGPPDKSCGREGLAFKS